MPIDSRPIILTMCCMAYNHEKYIRQALEGMVMQKTNFRYEIVVHDDLSSDRTRDIICEFMERYPELITPIFVEENQWTKYDGSCERSFDPFVHGKYMTFLDADDYWTDPYKVQKEVDILENHPEVMLVHTNYRTVDDDCNPISRIDFEFLKSKIRSGQVFHNMIRRNFVLTATVCMRREVVFSPNLDTCPSLLDYCFYINAAALGDLWFIDEETADYRLAPQSSTQKHYYWSEHQAAKVYEHFAELFLLGKVKKMSWWDRQKINYSIIAREIEVLRKRRIGHESIAKKHCWLWIYVIFYPFEILFNKLKK